MKHALLLLPVLLIILSGCTDNQTKGHDGEGLTYGGLIEEYKDYAYEGGYTVHVFIKKNPIPDSVDKLNDLQDHSKYDGYNIHRSVDSAIESVIDYKKIFNKEKYPFFLIISKEEVELTTYSIDEVMSFFNKISKEKEETP